MSELSSKEDETKREPCCVFFNKHSQRKNQLRKRTTVGPTLRTNVNKELEEKKDDSSSDEGEGNETDILGVLPLKRNKRTPLSEIQSVFLFYC